MKCPYCGSEHTEINDLEDDTYCLSWIECKDCGSNKIIQESNKEFNLEQENSRKVL